MLGRELKFRIWDGQEFSNNFTELFFPSWVITEPQPKTISFQGERSGVVIQQYTGFKDKVGAEIFEGDIVTFAGLNYEVVWSNGWVATCPYYCKYHWPKFSLSSGEGRGSTVVGNIFENKQLLTLKGAV